MEGFGSFLGGIVVGAALCAGWLGGYLIREGNDLARRAIQCGASTMVSEVYNERPTINEAQDYCEGLLNVAEKE